MSRRATWVAALALTPVLYAEVAEGDPGRFWAAVIATVVTVGALALAIRTARVAQARRRRMERR